MPSAACSPARPARTSTADFGPEGLRELALVGESRAGAPFAGELGPGECAAIYTGAELPRGADAVVIVEQSRALADGRVRLEDRPKAGQHLCRRASDLAVGMEVLACGRRVRAVDLALLAAVGCEPVPVVRRPRVAVFSTGDELAMPGQPLPPGAIYNSNRFTLRGLLQAAGCEVGDLGIVPDRLDATRAALRQAAEGHDLILTSGGVSVGEEDHLKPAVEAEGRLEHWQMAIKPGKPLAFGEVRRPDGSAAMFVGLPGNPVSSFVTFLLCVAPLLRVMQGAPAGLPAALPLAAGFDWPRPDKRREFLRVRLDRDGRLALFPNQSSGVLTSAAWADGLVDNPPGQVIRAGDAVRYLPLASLIAR